MAFSSSQKRRKEEKLKLDNGFFVVVTFVQRTKVNERKPGLETDQILLLVVCNPANAHLNVQSSGDSS